MTQGARFPSTGNKTSGIARHEERKFRTGMNLLPWPIIPVSKTAHTPTEGFQPQEGYEVLAESSNSQMSSPRLEHFGHLWAPVPSTGVGAERRVREEIGE